MTTSRQGYTLYRSGKPEIVETKDPATGKIYDITADAVNDFVEGARTGKLENAAFTAVESSRFGAAPIGSSRLA